MARAAKRDKFHSEAEAAVYELLDEVAEQHHKDLTDSAYLILLKHGGWQSKGKHMLGKVQLLNDAFRRTMKKDVIIYLNADMWRALSKAQKAGLLDHLLYGLDTATDRHANVKTASDGRPLLTTRPHDFEGFIDVVRRHGPIMEDIKRLAKALNETGQLTIEEIAAANDETLTAPPHEGITGTINEDGTINLDGQPEQEDENQMTLDQVAAASEDPKVTDISKAKGKRGKKDAGAPPPADDISPLEDDDDLPI